MLGPGTGRICRAFCSQSRRKISSFLTESTSLNLSEVFICPLMPHYLRHRDIHRNTADLHRCRGLHPETQYTGHAPTHVCTQEPSKVEDSRDSTISRPDPWQRRYRLHPDCCNSFLLISQHCLCRLRPTKSEPYFPHVPGHAISLHGNLQ